MGDPYYEDGAVSGRGYDDDESYYLGPNPLDEPRRLPAAVIDAAPPSPAASGFDSDATIYDDDMEGAGNGAAVAPAAPAPAPGKKGFKCRLCAKEFDSIKAVNGHTKVHATAAKGSKARRGGKAPQVDYLRSHISMAIAAAAAAAPEEPPKLLPAPAVAVAVVQHDGPKPIQLAIASTTTSTSPNQQSLVAVKELSKSDSSPMDNQQQQDNSSVPPPPATELAEPEPKPQQEEEEEQAGMAKPLLPSAAQAEEQAVVVYQQPAAGNNGNSQQQRGYFPCKEEGCGKWYPTHQGLAGHAAGHKNKRLRQEALAAGGEGAMACHGAVAKPAKMHACDQCDMVYARGQELGGHKRRHYQGKPIVPKKKKKQEAQQQPAQQAAAAPVVERVVRLFGVDIGKAQQAQQQEPTVDDKQ